MSEVLVAPDNLLEAHCAAVALERAGLSVSLVPGPDVTAVVVVAPPEEVPDRISVLGPGGAVPLLLVCPVVDDAVLRTAARIGADAVLAWDGPTELLVEAVAGLTRGEGVRPEPPAAADDPMRVLTHRERQIARLMGRGATNLGIAEELDISYHTVRTHVRHLMAKLDVTHRYAIVPIVQRSENARRVEDDLVEAVVR